MRFIKSFMLFLLISFAAGCGMWDPTKGISAKAHANRGAAYEQTGAWDLACNEFTAAARDLEKDVPGGPLYAVVYYELGRCLGVLGKFDESEMWLQKALKRDEARGDPIYLDLTELARLHFDQGRYQEAVKYFDLLMHELERIDAMNKAPAAYSDLLREYATALQKLGRVDEAREKLEIVERLKIGYPRQHSYTDRTPYGKFKQS